MHVTCDQEGGIFVCRLEGNLESLTVAQFRDALAGLPAASGIVFDMEAVSFIDSAGLGALIGAVRRAREAGGDAVVCRPRPSVNRVLQLVGLPRIVPVTADPEEARRLLQTPKPQVA